MPDFYGSVAGYRTYHTARNRDVSEQLDTTINAGLLVASEWLDATYRLSFAGLKVGQRSQLREWPRQGVQDIYGYAVESDSVPNEIDNATYEAAYRETISAGSLSRDFTPSKYKRAQVDGAVNVEYFGNITASDIQTRFQIVDEILAPILTRCNDGGGLSGGANRV